MQQVSRAVVLALVLTACGVPAQDAPSPVQVAALTAEEEASPPAGGSEVALVHFVRGRRLEAVARPTSELSPQAALDLLVSGPTRRQVASAIRTALAPQALTALPQDGARGTVVVAASRDFAGVTGADQLLAVAQVVWTVTGIEGVDRVHITVDGAPVEVPTDAGLSREPVARADYASVAPTREVRRTPRRHARRRPHDALVTVRPRARVRGARRRAGRTGWWSAGPPDLERTS